jgi:hemerythrin
LMSWSNKFSVGVKTLDDQHRNIIESLNELHAAAMKGQMKEVAGSLLAKLISYAREHFSAEERLMESAKFPGLAEHRAKHQELAGKAGVFISRHEKGDATVYIELLHFVRDWQTKHMQNEDQEYARWFSAHGVH